MKKGFTLIELLAVIVILAIIALIATPIILGIINDAKEDSEKRSVENYAHAVELAIARYATKQGGVIEEGIYSIEDEGKTIKKGTTEIQIDYKGEAIKTGSLKVLSDGKIELSEISFNGKKAYNYTEKDGVTSGETKEEAKEITHVILPDGTLLYYKGSGDIKVPATLDGIAIKSIKSSAFNNINLILFIYLDNPEECALDEDKCSYVVKTYLLDSNITKENIKYFTENFIGVIAEDKNIIYPKSSKEIINEYNSLISRGIEVDYFAGFFEFENGELVSDISYNTKITAIDLSELDYPYLSDDAFRGLTSLKVVILPKMDIFDDRPFYGNVSLEKIIVPYKEGEIPAGWNSWWNYDGGIDEHGFSLPHIIEYAG